jgi:hypothetical protein
MVSGRWPVESHDPVAHLGINPGFPFLAPSLRLAYHSSSTLDPPKWMVQIETGISETEAGPIRELDLEE